MEAEQKEHERLASEKREMQRLVAHPFSQRMKYCEVLQTQ